MATWSDLKIKLIGTGDETGTWGETTNANFNNAIEQAITGSATITFTDADYVLTLVDSTDLQDARALRLFLTGAVSTTRELTVPAIQKFYIIDNDLTQNITVKNPTGAGTYTVPAGTTALVFSTGSGVVSALSYFSGALTSFLAVITGGTIDDTPVGSSTPSTGAFTTLAASSATLTTPLPVTSGGSGVSTSTGTGSVVLSSSPSLTSPSMSDATMTGTPTAPTATSGTSTTQVATTAFTTGAVDDLANTLGTMALQDANAVAITGGTITGITDLAVADGGTGSSSLAANNVLLGNGTSALQTVAPSTAGNVLVSNGTTWVSGSKFTQGTAITLTNQASVDFTVPTWVKRIIVMWTSMSSNGTSDYLIQLGSSSGVTTTGYVSHSTSVNTTSASVASTSGYIIRARDGASDVLGGMMTLCNLTGNTWVSNLMCYIQGTNNDVGAGQVTLPNPVTTVRLTFDPGSGSSTFYDAGTINVMYE